MKKFLLSYLQENATKRVQKKVYTLSEDGKKENHSITFGEFYNKVKACAGFLQKEFQPGQRIAIAESNPIQGLIAFSGSIAAGMIPVMHPSLNPNQRRSLDVLDNIMTTAQPVAFFSGKKEKKLVSESLDKIGKEKTPPILIGEDIPPEWEENFQEPDFNPEGTAYLQYSSGSTSQPKGIIITHRNLWENQNAINGGCHHDYNTTLNFWLPLNHDMGLVSSLIPLFTGASCILQHPVAFIKRPYIWLQAISQYHVNTTSVPCFALDAVIKRTKPEIKEKLDLSSLKSLIIGSEPVQAKTVEKFITAFQSCGLKKEAILPAYGLAEATLAVSGEERGRVFVTKSFDAKALLENKVVEVSEEHSGKKTLVGNGQALAGLEIRIVSPDSPISCPSGEVGEIWLRGPSISPGYFQNEAASKETFQNALQGEDPEKIYLRTGDQGFFYQGELYIPGRKKEMLIIRGKNYYPLDIETTVQEVNSLLARGCAFSVEKEEKEVLILLQEVDRKTKEEELPILAKEITKRISEEHTLSLDTLVFLKKNQIRLTTSGKAKRMEMKSLFLEGTLENVLSQFDLYQSI